MGENEDQNQHIICQCGFEAYGPNSEQNVLALQEHEHWEVDEPKPWPRYVFSFEGALFIFIVLWFTVQILHILVK